MPLCNRSMSDALTPVHRQVEAAPLPIRLGGYSQQPLQGMRWHKGVGTVGERLLDLLAQRHHRDTHRTGDEPFPAPVSILRSLDIIAPTSAVATHGWPQGPGCKRRAACGHALLAITFTG